LIHDLSDSSAAPVSFGPFRVLHQIGVGVLGPVYRAQDSVREQLVAVKVFKVDAPPEQAEEIADALQAVAQALPRHRGLLEYIATGVERSTPYLVMTHSDVPSLDTRLKPGVALDAEEALDLIATLADAIDSAHAKGIIHGTLHPRDVFVDDRGGCRVSGFGVATTLTAAGIRVVPVRRPYSPPERVVGAPIERAADLFALGALAFELFSGRRVIGTGLDAAVRCAVSAPDVDVEHLRTALAAMLAENPVHRPSSATAFAQAVTQAVRPRGLTAATARKRVTPHEIKLTAAAGAGAAAAAAAAAATSDTAAAKSDAATDGSADDPALELFTRQGTLWEANRPAETEGVRLETVTVAPDEDPLAQFTSEASVAAAASTAAANTATPAASEPFVEPDTQPIPAPGSTVPRIDDESSDDEVASIADAARHLARTRESQPTSVRPTEEPAEESGAADAVEPAPSEHDFDHIRRSHGDDADMAIAAAAAAAPVAASATTSHDHDRELGSLRGWTAEEPAESTSNPLRMLFIVLAVGLAIGVAGGYLLGQRSALRQAFALFRGDGGSTASQPAAAPDATSTSSAPPPPAGAPTEVSEPAVIPEGTITPRTESRTRKDSPPASKTPAASPAAASAAPAARTAERGASRAESGREAAATTGRLLVRSSPARAEVMVNGVKRGETPVTLRDLPFGTHTIRVSRGGYLPSTRKVTLSASRASDALDIDLEAERPARTATAPRERAGAAGSGAAGGATAAGAAGVAAAGGDPDVAERASAEATAAGLGALYVLSHPAAARVFVDGQYVGSTPLLVTNVPPGTKTVRLELPGHKTWSSSVRVTAGQRLRVAASLEEGTEN
jgi:hypothetical protein